MPAPRKVVDLDIAEKLAQKGYTNAMIYTAIGCGSTYGQRNKALKAAIKRGREVAKSIVVDALFARAVDPESSPAAAIFLAKQLKIFEDPFTTSTPKSIKEMTGRIAAIYKAAAGNELSVEKADKLIGYLSKMIDAHSITELEERIKKLEEEIQ